MQKSKIEWTDFTWNPITGCKKGCSYCYARKKAENPFYKKAFPFGFTPHFYPERLNEPAKAKPSSKIFVCSMGELFGDNPEWTAWILGAIRQYPSLTFQLLTKQPQNLARWSPFPPNCWVGVSATNAEMYWHAWHGLKGVEAKVKFISFEPLLAGIAKPEIGFMRAGINWLIIGSQTQPVKHPPKEWVDEIIGAADRAKIPVFVKSPMSEFYALNRKETPCKE